MSLLEEVWRIMQSLRLALGIREGKSGRAGDCHFCYLRDANLGRDGDAFRQGCLLRHSSGRRKRSSLRLGQGNGSVSANILPFTSLSGCLAARLFVFRDGNFIRGSANVSRPILKL